ncbi:hypothetical protein LJB77_02685 [Ruminococcaceae bacterium OttesenSCG-928-N02]|nr:hypothetical protein [Ruminococcaceae bacterium OttesenSCG-928-N02]
MNINEMLQSDDIFERIEALRDLDDQSLLIHIAMNDEEDLVRLHAVGRVTDSAALAQIAQKYHTDTSIVEKAIENISNQADLIALMEFLKDKNTSLYYKAHNAIQDKDFLFSSMRNTNGRTAVGYGLRLHNLELSDSDKSEIWDKMRTEAEKDTALWLYMALRLPESELVKRNLCLDKRTFENEDQYGRHDDTAYTVFFNGNEVYYGR